MENSKIRSADSARPRKRISFGGFLEKRAGMIFILPIVIYFLIFFAYPLIQLVYLSFTNQQGVFSLVNWANLTADPYIWSVALTTIYYSVGSFVLEFGLGFVVAVLMYFYRGRLSSFFRITYSIPLMFSPVVAALLFLLIYNQNYGPMNFLLGFFGAGRIDWIGSTTYALPSLILVNMWEYSPYVFILVFAALLTVPVQIIEAAEIDGMSRFQQFRYIMLPASKGPMLVAALLNIVGILKSFDLVYVLTYGGPGTSTSIMSFYIYEVAFSFIETHYAAVLSLVYLIATVVIVAVLLKGTSIEREIGLRGG